MKVKSHVDIGAVVNPVDAYHAMGNRFADELAKRTTARDNSDFHRFSWEVAEWYQHQLELVGAIQPFLAKAEALRLDGLQKQTVDNTWEFEGTFTLEHAILWSPCNLQPRVSFIPSERLLAAFQPSPGVLLQMIRWCELLEWPTQDDTSGGISWYELMVSFVLVTNCRFPVATERKVQHPIFRDFALRDDAILFQQTVWDMVRFLEGGTQFIKRFAGVSVMPLEGQHKRWYLSYLGYQKRVNGLPLRPKLPLQLEHFALLKTLVNHDELKPPPHTAGHGWIPREVLVQDRLSHRERYLNHRSLSHFVKKHGTSEV